MMEVFLTQMIISVSKMGQYEYGNTYFMAIHVISPARIHNARIPPNTAPMMSGKLSHLLTSANKQHSRKYIEKGYVV